MNSTAKQVQNTPNITKRSYSYNDLLKMQSTDIYSSIGKVIPSSKPSAPYATFGHSQRKANVKKFEGEEMAKIDVKGKIGLGPAAYLPPRYTLASGEIITGKNPANDITYKTSPFISIGKEKKGRTHRQTYNYMNNRNDDLDTNTADLFRKNSSPTCKIGTETRFPDQRKDKITPGPTYDAVLKPNVESAPKYTLGSRRQVKGQDPLVPPNSTTVLVGPGAYFPKRSQSEILRIPPTSTIKNQPAITFAKGPKSLATYKNSIDETYDLKTKTMMAHYDFEYDAGKGLNTGLAYMKKNLANSSSQPITRNKMKSYSITHAGRETEKKRGTFVSMMSQVPQSVRMNHPKF